MTQTARQRTTAIQATAATAFETTLVQAGEPPSHLSHQRLHFPKFTKIPERYRAHGLLTQLATIAGAMQQKLAAHQAAGLLTHPATPLPQLVRLGLLGRRALT